MQSGCCVQKRSLLFPPPLLLPPPTVKATNHHTSKNPWCVFMCALLYIAMREDWGSFVGQKKEVMYDVYTAASTASFSSVEWPDGWFPFLISFPVFFEGKHSWTCSPRWADHQKKMKEKFVWRLAFGIQGKRISPSQPDFIWRLQWRTNVRRAHSKRLDETVRIDMKM